MTDLTDGVVSTEQQLALYGCDLIDLLRREGRHSNLWFAHRLIQAADELERAALTAQPATSPSIDGLVLLRELRGLFDSDGALFCSGEYQLDVIARVDAALAGEPSQPASPVGDEGGSR